MSNGKKHLQPMAFYCDYQRLVQIKAANDYMKDKERKFTKQDLEKSLKRDLVEFICIFICLIVLISGISWLEHERKQNKISLSVASEKRLTE